MVLSEFSNIHKEIAKDWDEYFRNETSFSLTETDMRADVVGGIRDSPLETVPCYDDPLQRLIARIEAAEEGERHTERLKWLDTLPPVERDVLILDAVGLKRKEIARARGVSEETIKTQLGSVRKKVRNRQEKKD